jgi:hypothetical protein
MRFALLGDHPDGLDMARALAESGRHELAVYCGPGPGAEYLRRWELHPARMGDLEEVLADPRIEAVIVAGGSADRPAQLRRALQSERHALCVHPLDENPDSAYEAAMLQADTGKVVLPLLPQVVHPGVRRLGELAYETDAANETPRAAAMPTAITPAPPRPSDKRHGPGFLCLLEMEFRSTERVLRDAELPAHEPGLPGWDVLRAVGGEVREVSALAATGELPFDEAIVVAGVFQHSGLFHILLLPNQPEARWRLTLQTRSGRSELLFPHGWPGPAQLSGIDAEGAEVKENWETLNPWPRLVDVFERAIAVHVDAPARTLGGKAPARRDVENAITADLRQVPPDDWRLEAAGPALLSWQDEIRCLELDDAARRSVARRRVTVLEYQEATEEAGFKGTMTLVGCSMIWLSLVLLIVAVWVPWLVWLIIPVFGFFLILQLLRWLVPGTPPEKGGKSSLPVG